MKLTFRYCRILFRLTLFSAAFIFPRMAAAQPSVKYRSAPNSLAMYMYQGDGVESVPLPADITVRFSGDGPTSMLTAVIHQPIIGDRVSGPDESIVEEFPMVVTGTLTTDGLSFRGDLLGTQYLFEWTFQPATNGDLLWSGGVGWAGGRYEETTIDNVRLLPLTPGDYSENGTVDAADYAIWRKATGQSGLGLAADGDGDNQVDNDDYLIWRANVGRDSSSEILEGAGVPEPGAWLLVIAAMAALLSRRARR